MWLKPNMRMKSEKVYTCCSEIPLCRFIEAYHGNLKALVISGKVPDEKLHAVFCRILDEYNRIIGNKNLSFSVSCHSQIINYKAKISILCAVCNLLVSGNWDGMKELLPYAGIRKMKLESVEDAEKLAGKLESELAYLRMRLKTTEEKIKRPAKSESKIDFTRERMIVSTHFKMYIDPKTYTAAEYANLVKLMLNEIEEIKKYGKRN